MNQRITITVENLCAGYAIKSREPSVLIDGFTTQLFSGDFIALIGRNGSGKSTLLRTLAKQQELLSGNLYMNANPYSNFRSGEFSKWVSFVSTEKINVPHLSVYELVSMGRFPYTNWFGKLNRKDHELIHASIEGVGISHLINRPVNELSDGEKQRALIARNVAQDTPVLLLDEPTAFLDLPNRYEIYELLHHLSRSMDKTIVLSTHDLNMALHEADKIWLLHDKKIFTGAPEDLVLNGSIENILKNSPLTFDLLNGAFKMTAKPRGKIVFDETSRSEVGIWTKNALDRLGFHLTKTSLLHLEVCEENDQYQWKLKDNKSEKVFNSIYELSLYLNNLKIINP